MVGPDDPENAPPFGLYDNPEERPLAERCLLAFGSSLAKPMLPIAYNNQYQIVQTPGYVIAWRAGSGETGRRAVPGEKEIA